MYLYPDCSGWRSLFERLHREKNSIILVTHEREIAEHADRVIYLRDGQIECDEIVRHE